MKHIKYYINSKKTCYEYWFESDFITKWFLFQFIKICISSDDFAATAKVFSFCVNNEHKIKFQKDVLYF